MVDFVSSRSRGSSKPLDSEFASLFGGIPHVSFETEEDRRLEAQIAEEVARLQQEVNFEQPRTPNINPFAGGDDEIVPIITKGSRRRRTTGQERPATAPANKIASTTPASSTTGFETRPLTVVKEASSTSGFAATEFSPLPVIREEVKRSRNASVSKEENLSPRSLKLKLLEKEMNNAHVEREKALAEVKSRSNTQLAQELEALDKDYQSNLEHMRHWFESKKQAVEDVRAQQEKILSLAQIISKNSQTISSLSNKFGKDKEYLEDIKFQELSAKERQLEARESRLLTQIQLLEQEKQRVSSRQHNLEDIEERYRRALDEDKRKISEEQRRMNELQESLKQQDKEKKQIVALELHRLDLLEEQIEREKKNIEEEIENKEKEIHEKETLMELEKNDSYKQIEFEKNLLHSQISHIENFKRSIPAINADLNRRISTCEEKSKQLRAESENLKKAREMLEKDRVLFEKEAQKIHVICMEIDKETESLMEQKADLEKRKQEIESKRQEVLGIISKSRHDKQRVDQLKTSLSNRVRVYESLKSPTKRIDIPKIDVSESEIEPIARMHSRPRSVISRCTFRASEYMKDLEQYSHARTEIQTYIAYEGERLLNSKLDYETGVNRGIHASIHGFSSPSSSYFGKASNSLYLHAGSFSKPEDSQYISSSFYRESFN